VRKTSAALAALALSAVALTGCSAAPSFAGATCDRTGSVNGIDEDITVSGDVGKQPKLELVGPLKVDKVSYFDATVGDGEPLVDANQVFLGGFAMYDGKTGAMIQNVGFDGQGQLFTISTIEQGLPDLKLNKALECATGGSRVVVAAPATDKGDSVIAVFDIDSTMHSRAEGADVFNNARGVPTVVRAPDGRPGIIIPDSKAPTKTVTQTLIAGDGAKVGDEQPFFAYTAVGWNDRKVAESTWGKLPEADLSKLPKQVADAVKSATVGSQLLVVVPGEGDAQAVAYVVDILGSVPSGK
jgi:peptidylprolyl isomerase